MVDINCLKNPPNSLITGHIRAYIHVWCGREGGMVGGFFKGR